MDSGLKGRVRVATLVLTLISLALVFGAAGRVVAPELLPHAPQRVVGVIPHVNAGLSVVALGAMAIGYRAIRRRNVGRHRLAMLTALAAFLLFLGLYLYKVALEGPRSFPGPETIHLYVYLPVLVVHVGLAIVCLPLLYYVALIALTHPIGEIPHTNHPRVARPALALWATTFLLGIAVYLQLYVLY